MEDPGYLPCSDKEVLMLVAGTMDQPRERACIYCGTRLPGRMSRIALRKRANQMAADKLQLCSVSRRDVVKGCRRFDVKTPTARFEPVRVTVVEKHIRKWDTYRAVIR